MVAPINGPNAVVTRARGFLRLLDAVINLTVLAAAVHSVAHGLGLSDTERFLSVVGVRSDFLCGVIGRFQEGRNIVVGLYLLFVCGHLKLGVYLLVVLAVELGRGLASILGLVKEVPSLTCEFKTSEVLFQHD